MCRLSTIRGTLGEIRSPVSTGLWYCCCVPVCCNSVPARLGKGEGAKEIGHNLAREQPKFGHNLVRKRQKIGHSLERE